jgi:hypothetical protein
VPKDVLSAIVKNALDYHVPLARIELSCPAESAH